MSNQEVELAEVNAELGKIETGSNPIKTENIPEGDGVVVDTAAPLPQLVIHLR